MTEPIRPAGDAERGTPPRMPRWVKASMIIGAVLVLLGLAVALLSGGQHGPGRHVGAPAPTAGQTTHDDGRSMLGVSG